MPESDPYADRPPTSHERMAGAPWDDSYRGDEPAPWDIGHPQPAIARLVEDGAFTGSVLDAGCGTGEHALLLAAHGCDVLGFDVAATAVEAARRKAADRHLTIDLRVADALHLDRLGGPFDHVLDVGLFHAFDAPERETYVAGLATAVRGGGALHLLCHSDVGPGEPGPHPVSEVDLRAAFAIGWTVRALAVVQCETTFAPDGVPSWLARIERTPA